MEKCKFVNSVNLSQSCDQPGRFRKESDHPEWPFDQDYLCDRHYKQVKTRVMRKVNLSYMYDESSNSGNNAIVVTPTQHY
jgi:hypothetical protein